MPSKYYHEIVVGNIGTVYSGNSTKEARENYVTYRFLSREKDLAGRVTGEDVTWLRDGEIYKEYHKPAPKLRTHNEYFSPVSLGNRKSCPTCGEKLPLGQSLWTWYEFVRLKKRLVMHFCKQCFPTQVRPRLIDHAADCGCVFNLEVHLGFNQQRPSWLSLETVEESVHE